MKGTGKDGASNPEGRVTVKKRRKALYFIPDVGNSLVSAAVGNNNNSLITIYSGTERRGNICP